MLTLLENVLDRADGTYVSAQDLRLIEQSLSSWHDRRDAYTAIQVNEGAIIRRALELMQDSDRFAAKPLNNLGVDRCQRDMLLGLRSCALAMLLEDQDLLKDRILYWQQNIFQAMNLNYQGYKFMWQAMRSVLTEKQAELMKPYLRTAHELMSGETVA
ncbi:MAG: phycobilisome protein [Cyanobacteria bacterium M5B4]|nr:phycobilisome protein [Cyanobacteria bacterium KgW148]PLS69464.1 MAG: phycobilisome protein [Cyanobacteria bacterium M5B4]